MGADTSEKIRDVISFVHSRTLSIGVYSPGDTSVANMYEEASSNLTEIIQQEIAEARIDELERIEADLLIDDALALRYYYDERLEALRTKALKRGE